MTQARCYLLASIATLLVSCGRPAAPASPSGPTPSPPPPEVHGTQPHARERTTELSANAVPQFFPSVVRPCPADYDVLGEAMKLGLNPQLNIINNALFHDTRPVEERLEAIAESSAVILGCVPVIGKLGKGHFDEAWPTFDHFVYGLVTNVSALQLAAQEDDLDEVRHWYQHVKHACASCHSRFWKK